MHDHRIETASRDGLTASDAARAVKARYFRLMDLKQWDDWEQLFTSDAVMDVRGEAVAMRSLGFVVPDDVEMVWHGASTIRRNVASALANVVTVHHGHMQEIEAAGADRITAIWSMADVLRFPQGAPVAGFNGYGHYYDVYERQNGGWRIKSITLTRLLVEPTVRITG